jgi:phasin family protein
MNFRSRKEIFAALHKKLLDFGFAVPIMQSMMHCNINAATRTGPLLFADFNQEITMYSTPEQFAGTNKANVETLLTMANTAFASAERLAALNLNTARTLLEDSVNTAKTLLAAKDAQELVSMQAALTQPAFEKVVAYSRSIYEIATQTQDEFSKIFDSQYVEINKNVTSALDKAVKNAPAGSDVAVAAVKSAIAAANSAYETMNKAAKQVAEMTEANVAAATSATVKAVGASAPKARKAA